MEGIVGGVIGGGATGIAVASTLWFERRHTEQVELRSEVAALHTMTSEWHQRADLTGVDAPEYSAPPEVEQRFRHALAPVEAKARLVAVRLKTSARGRRSSHLAQQLDVLISELILWNYEPTPIRKLLRTVIEIHLWCDAWLTGAPTAPRIHAYVEPDDGKQILDDRAETPPTAEAETPPTAAL